MDRRAEPVLEHREHPLGVEAAIAAALNDGLLQGRLQLFADGLADPLADGLAQVLAGPLLDVLADALEQPLTQRIDRLVEIGPTGHGLRERTAEGGVDSFPRRVADLVTDDLGHPPLNRVAEPLLQDRRDSLGVEPLGAVLGLGHGLAQDVGYALADGLAQALLDDAGELLAYALGHRLAQGLADSLVDRSDQPFGAVWLLAPRALLA